jgi:8-oxo-dGTP diphosphatase
MCPPHRNPLPTVDVIIELDGRDRIVLVRRRHPPLGWALPGGFVEAGEPLFAAAVREAREETGLEVTLVEQFFTYSDPARDPRRHTVSTVFLGQASGSPHAGDDAAEVAVVPLGAWSGLAFDHETILSDYLEYRRNGRRPPADR